MYTFGVTSIQNFIIKKLTESDFCRPENCDKHNTLHITAGKKNRKDL